MLLFIPNFMTLGCAPLAVLYNHKAGPASPEEDAPPLLLEAVDSRGATNKEAIFWTLVRMSDRRPVLARKFAKTADSLYVSRKCCAISTLVGAYFWSA